MKKMFILTMVLVLGALLGQGGPLEANKLAQMRLPEDRSEIKLGDLTFYSSIEEGGKGEIIFTDKENNVTVLIKKSELGFTIVSAKAKTSMSDKDGDGIPESAIMEEEKDGKVVFLAYDVKLELKPKVGRDQ